MELKKVDIKEFKKTIYPVYVKMFPDYERKPYTMIYDCYQRRLTEIIEVLVDNKFVGFGIISTTQNSKYILLDYFAILPQYQNIGFGTKALKLLQEMFKDFDGIFIEVDKLGLGTTEEDNIIRKRRVKFYKNVGAVKLNFELSLFNVMFSSYILPCSEYKFNDEKVIKEIFKIYNAIYNEKNTKEKCKVII